MSVNAPDRMRPILIMIVPVYFLFYRTIRIFFEISANLQTLIYCVAVKRSCQHSKKIMLTIRAVGAPVSAPCGPQALAVSDENLASVSGSSVLLSYALGDGGINSEVVFTSRLLLRGEREGCMLLTASSYIIVDDQYLRLNFTFTFGIMEAVCRRGG